MDELNATQQLAVNHLEGPLLILAGAGVGKTRVVTCRIAHLLQIGIPPSDIVGLTFTNKAAQEMRERVKRLANQSVLIATFHSLGARILRESIDALGHPRDFTIYDEQDCMHVLKNCFSSRGYKAEKGTFKKVKMVISEAKNRLLTPREMELDVSLSERQLIEEMFLLYQEKLKSYHALDFDDLLYLTVKLFQECPAILKKYQKRWSFILIDEYQDTNHAQYVMTKLLGAYHRNLFVVGDPDQGIYGWRGANVQNILGFETDYPDAQIMTLEQNYRSQDNILQAANALIKWNKKRYEKKLWSALGKGEKITVYSASDEKDEAQFVVNELMRQVNKHNICLNDCVIFYRTHAQSRAFEDALLKYQIPYVLIGGMSFYQRREIKDILAFLRLIVSGSDFLAFARTLNLPPRGIGKTTLTKLRVHAEQKGMPILAFCNALIRDPCPSFKISAKQHQGLRDFLYIIDDLKKQCQPQTSIQSIVESAIRLTGYETYLRDDPETYIDRKDNLQELVNKAAEWEEELAQSTNLLEALFSFLEELSLKSSLDDASAHRAVRLMTLHTGKGLEFRFVMITGMEEDILPHINAKENQEALEEERCLCFVGMTRAKEQLYFTLANRRLIWGQPKMMVPSRFLKEIPNHLLNYHHPLEGEEPLSDVPKDALPIGSLVSHREFGKGRIEKVYETSLGLTYDVYFFHTGTRRSLVSAYARLQPLLQS